MKTTILALAALASTCLLSGCGTGQPDCSTVSALGVGPTTATADHSAKAPGDTVQFTASVSQALVHPQNACGLPAHSEIVQPAWTVSDPAYVTISSAKDATNGLVTCIGETSGPVTVSASSMGSSGPITATATVSCQ